MDFDLNEEQDMLRRSVREFADRVLEPRAAELDRAAAFPAAEVEQMAAMGLMGVAIDSDYGGAGMDALAYAVAVEEISRGCASCGVIMSVNNSLTCDPIARYGSDAQRSRWLPGLCDGTIIGCFALSEPGTGSDAAAQQTTARRQGDDWVLHGAKNFITNGAQAGVCVLLAMGDRSLGVKGINAFVVPTDLPGYAVAKNEHKLGIRASSTSQISLDNVVVPGDALLGRPGEGFKIALSTLDGGRIGIAAQAVGIAQAAYEAALRYAGQREAFGRPIGHLQAIQMMVADMATEIRAARLLVWRAAWLKQAGQSYGPASAIAKLYASEMSGRVTSRALQIFGGYGFCCDFPAERHFRDARITEIYEGTSEVQRLVIARSVLAESA